MAKRSGYGTGVERIRDFALDLPRAYEAVVGGRIKFRVGQIVFVAFSADETKMGFGFPKEERQALVDSEPHKFELPDASNMRYRWVVGKLDAIDDIELRELVLDAWKMCVPKSVAATRPTP
jgi:hypothetical protein